MTQVAVVAHRGASGTFPESTVPAFQEAIRLGVEMIELDVHLTRDGRLAIIHDPTVDRTSDGTGRVGEMDWAEIKRLDAGSWFDPRFAGEGFLSLEQTLDLMPPGMRLNVHIKASDQDREEVVPLVVRELGRRELLEEAFVASDEDSLAVARQTNPEVEICNLSTAPAETYVARCRAIGCRILQPGNGMTMPQLVEEAHGHGMEVNPFYADDEVEMRRLIDCGVDGILTNFPERLQELRRRLDSGRG